MDVAPTRPVDKTRGHLTDGEEEGDSLAGSWAKQPVVAVLTPERQRVCATQTQVLYLSNMAVAPRARRSGVASSLLRAAIAHADALQVKRERQKRDRET